MKAIVLPLSAFAALSLVAACGADPSIGGSDSSSSAAIIGGGGGGGGGGDKVTICHATHSDTNPYVEITISVNALAAHRSHQDGEDIIPAPAGGCPDEVAEGEGEGECIVPACGDGEGEGGEGEGEGECLIPGTCGGACTG
jgi:hypothetical protein